MQGETAMNAAILCGFDRTLIASAGVVPHDFDKIRLVSKGFDTDPIRRQIANRARSG